MHHCDNPSCVNPKHLKLATHLENEQDKDKKDRRPFDHVIKYGDDIVYGIFDKLYKGWFSREIWNFYGLPRHSYEGIVHRRNNKDHKKCRVREIFNSFSKEKRDTIEYNIKNQGERCTSSKLTKDDVLKIRSLRENGMPISKIAENFPVHVHHVGRICRRERWKSV